MLPLSAVQQSLIQARKASRELRSLLRATDRPSAHAVRACMEAGAQVDWMSQQGTQSAENALVAALSRGYWEAVEVILEYTQNVPAPRGSSLFAKALGPCSHVNHPEDFSRCVAALQKHGYGWADEYKMSEPTLASAFSSRHLSHPRTLLKAGMGEVMKDRHVAEAVLTEAMRRPGGIKLLLAHVSGEDMWLVKERWWSCAVASAGSSPGASLEEVVRKGLELSPPSPERIVSIGEKSLLVLVEMVRQGLALPAVVPGNEWENGGQPEPLWRRIPTQIQGFLETDAPVDGLRLGSRESVHGMDWLSFMAKERGVIIQAGYRPKGNHAAYGAILGRALAAGFCVDGRDTSGLTAGWHILSALMGDSDGHRSSNENTQGWLDVVIAFGLHAPPIMVDGQPVAVLDAENGRFARLFEQFGRLDNARVIAEHWGLAQETPTPARPNSIRRM